MSQSEADRTGLRGTNEGTKLKATSGWNHNGNGTDDFGFSAIPGGYRNVHGYFVSFGTYGNWWNYTEESIQFAWSRALRYGSTGVFRNYTSKENGFSVRCVRD